MTAIPAPFSGIPRVNLMPRIELARRERDKLVRLWAWLVVGAIIVALLVVAGAFGFKILADQRLAAEQRHTNTLLTEIAALAEVSQALATEAELTGFRGEAMATDLAWTAALAKVTGILPDGTALTGYDFTVGGVPQGDDPAAEPGLVGTFAVDSPTPLDIVAIIRSLRGVEGVLYADGQSVTSSQQSVGRYSYLLNVVLDQTAYSGEYAAEEGGE